MRTFPTKNVSYQEKEDDRAVRLTPLCEGAWERVVGLRLVARGYVFEGYRGSMPDGALVPRGRYPRYKRR